MSGPTHNHSRFRVPKEHTAFVQRLVRYGGIERATKTLKLGHVTVETISSGGCVLARTVEKLAARIAELQSEGVSP